jgi:hypothetical protein
MKPANYFNYLLGAVACLCLCGSCSFARPTPPLSIHWIDSTYIGSNPDIQTVASSLTEEDAIGILRKFLKPQYHGGVTDSVGVLHERRRIEVSSIDKTGFTGSCIESVTTSVEKANNITR